MAPRPLAAATISFGLVSIPVRLFTTTNAAESISFRMLHDKCKGPVKYQYWCPQDDEVVERADIVKGYEYAKNQFVVFTPEEIKAMEEEATKAIAIEEFVPLEKVDGVYFDKSYYIGPEKGGGRAYRLLAKAMEIKGIGGLARYAARGKQYLVLLRPLDGRIVMQQLRYAKEVRAFDDVPMEDGAKADVKDTELKLAMQLIEQTTADEFRPESYEDEVKGRMQEHIQEKIEGQEISIAPADAPKTKVIDLMDALKASLGGSGSTAGDGDEAAKKPARSGKKAAVRKPAKASTRKPAKKSAASGRSKKAASS